MTKNKQEVEILNYLSDIKYTYDGWEIEISHNPIDEVYIGVARKGNLKFADRESFSERFFSRCMPEYYVEQHVECVDRLKYKIEIRIKSLDRGR